MTTRGVDESVSASSGIAVSTANKIKLSTLVSRSGGRGRLQWHKCSALFALKRPGFCYTSATFYEFKAPKLVRLDGKSKTSLYELI